MVRSLIATLLLGASLQALAACPSLASVQQLARDWETMTPSKSVDKDGSMEDAICARRMLVTELAKTQGKIVGYKAGLTNKAVQQRFAYNAPVLGVLFEKM